MTTIYFRAKSKTQRKREKTCVYISFVDTHTPQALYELDIYNIRTSWKQFVWWVFFCVWFRSNRFFHSLRTIEFVLSCSHFYHGTKDKIHSQVNAAVCLMWIRRIVRLFIGLCHNQTLPFGRSKSSFFYQKPNKPFNQFDNDMKTFCRLIPMKIYLIKWINLYSKNNIRTF